MFHSINFTFSLNKPLNLAEGDDIVAEMNGESQGLFTAGVYREEQKQEGRDEEDFISVEEERRAFAFARVTVERLGRWMML